MSRGLFSKISANVGLLGLVALTGAGVLATIDHWATPQVQINRAQALRNQLAELVPEELYDAPLEQGVKTVTAPRLGAGEQQIYRARRAGKVTAVLITAQVADGYNGAIRLLLAVNGDERILGVRVLEHRETPGLGDAIETRKSDWVLGFNGRSLNDPEPAGWAVRKDGGRFDQITAATITPRAVVGGVKRALEYIQAHKIELFEINNT